MKGSDYSGYRTPKKKRGYSRMTLYIYIYNLEKFFLAKIDIEKRKNS